MDSSGIVFVVLFGIIMLVILGCALKYREQVGKYNYGNNTKKFDGIYQDPEKGDLRKCHYAKIAKISWEGIDNLCPDVD